MTIMKPRDPYRGAIRLIVCDLAGTTVDYGSRAPAGAFRELFRRHGLDCSDAEARAPMGMHKRDHIREMLRQPGLSARWQARFHRPWTEEDVDRLYAEFIPLQTSVLLTFNQVIPGAVETVRLWRTEGVKVAATTGYDREMTRLVVEDAAAQGLVFDAVCGAEEVPAGRPAPWMIYRCMEATGVYPPAAVLKIGDTLADMEDGRNAGVWTLGVTRTGNMMGLSREDEEALSEAERQQRMVEAEAAMRQAGAHGVVGTIAEAPAVMQELCRRLAQGERP